MGEVLIGFNAVLEALKAGRRDVGHLYLGKDRRDGRIRELLSFAKAKGVPLTWEPKARLTARVGTTGHQGVVALVAQAKYHEVEELLDLAKRKGEPPFFLVIDGVEDPQNLGSILRTAEAAGVDGIILPKHRAVGLNQTVAKVACGALEYVSVARVPNISSCLERLKHGGFWIAGADPKAPQSCYEADLRGPLALVIGGEDVGLRPAVKGRCDLMISIPMKGHISSLNTAVAAAILVFEVIRQRDQQRL